MNVGLLISGISWALGALAIMVICSRLYKNPGSPNRLVGYRTARSLASQKNWVILNKVAMDRFRRSAYILVVMGGLLIGLSFIVPSDLLYTTVLGFLPIALVIAPGVRTYLDEDKILNAHRNGDDR